MKKPLILCIMTLIFSGSLFAHQGPNVEKLISSDSSWDGRPLPKAQLDSPTVNVLRITIPPHARLPVHKHPVINAGYLVKGRLTVVRESDGHELHLKAGDALVEMVDTWHYGKNPDSKPAEIVVFYIGNKDQALTIKK